MYFNSLISELLIRHDIVFVNAMQFIQGNEWVMYSMECTCEVQSERTRCDSFCFSFFVSAPTSRKHPSTAPMNAYSRNIKRHCQSPCMKGKTNRRRVATKLYPHYCTRVRARELFSDMNLWWSVEKHSTHFIPRQVVCICTVCPVCEMAHTQSMGYSGISTSGASSDGSHTISGTIPRLPTWDLPILS